MEKLFYASLAVAVIGVLLLSGGLTGMVVSESCCFGPTCMHLCDAAEPEQIDHQYNTTLGVLLLVAALEGLLIYNKLNV